MSFCSVVFNILHFIIEYFVLLLPPFAILCSELKQIGESHIGMHNSPFLHSIIILIARKAQTYHWKNHVLNLRSIFQKYCLQFSELSELYMQKYFYT